MKGLIILGAGGFGTTIADVVTETNLYDEILFLDDNSLKNEVCGKCNEYIFYDCENYDVYPAFGNNELRLLWISKLTKEGYKIPNIIHPTAYISKTVKLGYGNVILPMAVVNTDCVIGNGCIINCGAILDHECTISDGVHICLGAIVKANNNISECTKIEAGKIVMNGVYT